MGARIVILKQNKRLVKIKEIVSEIERISGLELIVKSHHEVENHIFSILNFNSTVELSFKTKAIVLEVFTKRVYYLEGLTLMALKNLGYSSKIKVPKWANKEYNKNYHWKKVPGNPQYQKPFWEILFERLLEVKQ
jgi:hypothetical protein